MSALLLLVAVGAMVWFLKGDLGAYRHLKARSDTLSRQRRYRLWIARAVIAFALPALSGLPLLDRLAALATVPPEFAGFRAHLPAFDQESFVAGLIGGAAVGGLVLGVLAVRRRRGAAFGSAATLLPRNRAERWHAAAMSIVAGVTEEIAFRLYLPLLIALTTGSAILGVVVATLLFGAMHRYQGWRGMAATALVGLAMTAVYLMTGALWLAMLLHALIDLNGLVLRSVLHPPAGAEDHRDHDQT